MLKNFALTLFLRFVTEYIKTFTLYLQFIIEEKRHCCKTEKKKGKKRYGVFIIFQRDLRISKKSQKPCEVLTVFL